VQSCQVMMKIIQMLISFLIKMKLPAFSMHLVHYPLGKNGFHHLVDLTFIEIFYLLKACRNMQLCIFQNIPHTSWMNLIQILNNLRALCIFESLVISVQNNKQNGCSLTKSTSLLSIYRGDPKRHLQQ